MCNVFQYSDGSFSSFPAKQRLLIGWIIEMETDNDANTYDAQFSSKADFFFCTNAHTLDSLISQQNRSS